MRLSSIAGVGLAMVLMCVMASASHSFDLGELAGDTEMNDMSLPNFPMPPEHDLKLLHMEKDASALRFRAVSEGEDETEAEEEDAEEQQSEDEVSDEAESDESTEAEVEVEVDAEEEVEATPQFVETSQHPGLRYARASPYNTRGILPGRPPIPALLRPETGPAAYARARVQPQQLTEAIFQPIHNSLRTYGRAGAPVPSLNAGANNYAIARGRVYPNYYYGNNLIPTPVNAQFYPTPNGIPARPFSPPPQPQPQPMAPPAPTPSAGPVAPSFAELNAGISAMTRTYSSWPSSIAPPAAYYLPPDVVV